MASDDPVFNVRRPYGWRRHNLAQVSDSIADLGMFESATVWQEGGLEAAEVTRVPDGWLVRTAFNPEPAWAGVLRNLLSASDQPQHPSQHPTEGGTSP